MNALGVGSLAAMLGVAFGAFGAHSLKARISLDMLAVFQTGVHYQLFHALALLVIGVLGRESASPLLRQAAFSMTLGICVFSGSLYVLAITGVRKWGMVTPIGGVCFLIGWALLTRYAFSVARVR